MAEKSNLKGYLSYFLSMLLYAFSGLIVVGLGKVFGNIAQVSLRALVSTLFAVLIVWLVIKSQTLRKWLNISNKAGFKFTKALVDGKKQGVFGGYNTKWFWVVLTSRTLSNICFVYAALTINPTAALFYLFASRVLMGAVIKYLADKKMNIYYVLSFITVIVGMLVFSNPASFVLGLGIIFAVAAGALEALKQQGYRELNPPDEDIPVVTLYEFFGTLILALLLMVVIPGNSFPVLTAIGLNYWLLLLFAGLVAALTVILDITGATNMKDPSLGNVIGATEMGFAALLNYIFLGTTMETFQIIGSAVIMLALIFVAFAKKKDKAEADRIMEEVKS